MIHRHHHHQRHFVPALVVGIFKSLEALAPKLPNRSDFLALAKQIRAGHPAPLNIGAPVEGDEMCLAVSLADGRIASIITRTAWMRDHQEDAEALRTKLADEAECDVLVISLPAAPLESETGSVVSSEGRA